MSEATEATKPTERAPLKKERVGKVVSDKMQKTVVVEITDFTKHRIYKRMIRRTTRYKAHDENDECRIGDVVRIVETRPLSKDKRWRVAEVVTRGKIGPALAEVTEA